MFIAEPDFVSSYDIGDFVYFFFRETAVEYINCGKARHTPVHPRTHQYTHVTPWHTHTHLGTPTSHLSNQFSKHYKLDSIQRKRLHITVKADQKFVAKSLGAPLIQRMVACVHGVIAEPEILLCKINESPLNKVKKIMDSDHDRRRN